ncbi:MAG: hypothetical protein ACLRFM_03190 [Alphaproteobacteria bacterium]
MKTKIIYISGSEVFNMADVRGAFDTVRRELGLTRDTILFGVPVDADDALGGQFDAIKPDVSQNVITNNTDTETPTTAFIAATASTAVVDDAPVVAKTDDVVAAPVKKAKRTKKVVTAPVVDDTPVDAPATKTDDDAVIPILSVLATDDAAKNDTVQNAPIADMTDIADIMDDDISLADTDLLDTKTDDAIDILDDLKTDDVAPVVDFDAADIDDEIPTVTPEVASVIDASDDDTDGLAKLLKSVQSLNEDELPKPELTVVENNIDVDETDATLEKLATEFAENQDKIVNTTKSSARGGRIGKLKNILPFKKAKSNESSLMGDLFGWAGVAANDEEFGIPEFFPTAAKK